jgi:hypothetical protein
MRQREGELLAKTISTVSTPVHRRKWVLLGSALSYFVALACLELPAAGGVPMLHLHSGTAQRHPSLGCSFPGWHSFSCMLYPSPLLPYSLRLRGAGEGPKCLSNEQDEHMAPAPRINFKRSTTPNDSAPPKRRRGRDKDSGNTRKGGPGEEESSETKAGGANIMGIKAGDKGKGQGVGAGDGAAASVLEAAGKVMDAAEVELHRLREAKFSAPSLLARSTFSGLFSRSPNVNLPGHESVTLEHFRAERVAFDRQGRFLPPDTYFWRDRLVRIEYETSGRKKAIHDVTTGVLIHVYAERQEVFLRGHTGVYFSHLLSLSPPPPPPPHSLYLFLFLSLSLSLSRARSPSLSLSLKSLASI